MADFYTNAAGETGTSLPPKAQFTADPDLLKKLAAQRASDAAGYQASVAQGESWAKPLASGAGATAEATSGAAQAAKAPGVISQWGQEAKQLGTSARSFLNGGAGAVEGAGMFKNAGAQLGKLAARGGAAGMALSAIDDAAAPDSTDRYAERFGVAPPTGDGSAGDIAKFAALRAGGFASDLGKSLPLVGGLVGGMYQDKDANYSKTPGIVSRLANGIGQQLHGSGFTDGFMAGPTGPVSAAAAKANGTAAPGATPNPVDQRTAGVIDEMNKRVGIAPTAQLAGVRGSPTSVAGITKLEGGQFNTPMYTDDPSRAAAEYAAQKGPQQTTTLVGGKPQTTVLDAEGNPQTYFPDLNKGAGGGRQLNSFAAGAGTGPLQAMARGASPQSAGDSLMTVPSTANADRAFLAGAFQRHVNSGDLERARATVDPHDQAQQAQLGAAELAQQRAQAQAYAAAPMETMLKTLLGKSDREKRLEGDITDRAFSGTRRGNVVPKTGDAEQINGLIQMLAANAAKGGNTDPSKAAAEALAGVNASAAAKAGLETQKTAQAGAQAGQLQMQALQQQLLKETDPKKREQIAENIQTLTGKYEKSAPQSKLYPIKRDTGKTDAMGQPIKEDDLYDAEAKEFVSSRGKQKSAVDPKQLRTEAQARLKQMGGSDAAKALINEWSKNTYGMEAL